MHILHISNDFSNSTVHASLYKELDGLGVDQIVFNPIRTSKRESIGKNEFPSLHTRFVYADVVKPIHRYLYHFKRRCIFKELLNKIDVTKFNLVHATTLLSDGGVALSIYRKYHIPYVVAVRNTDINGFLDKMPHTWLSARSILLNAQRIFFISQGLKEKFENHRVIKPFVSRIKDKMVLIPNGIDDYYLANIQTAQREGHKVIYIGDFSNNKNVLRLGKAILQLQKEPELSDISLTIIGGGNNEDDSVEKMINSYPKVFHYVGKIYDKEVLCSIMREHKAFAMPSIHETFGLVYIEALSQNLPVLYTKGQGIDGLFDGAVGIGVNPLSIKEIASALKQILLSSGVYSNACVDFDAFRWSTIALKYREHYRDLLGCAAVRRSLLADFVRIGGGQVKALVEIKQDQKDGSNWSGDIPSRV